MRRPVALHLPRPQRAAMHDRLSSPLRTRALHGFAQRAVEHQRAAFELIELAGQGVDLASGWPRAAAAARVSARTGS